MDYQSPRMYRAVSIAAASDPGEQHEPYTRAASCPDCAGKHPDYRSDYGHLEYDAASGATVLVPHRQTPIE